MATEVEQAESRIGPPFLPFATIQNVIQVFAEKGVPPLVDKRTFATASGAMQAEIVRALKFLALIDASGKPTDTLYSLASARVTDEQSFQNELREVLRDAYAPIFDLNLDSVTEPHLRDEFAATYELTGESSKKAMTFFLKAAQKAGISISSWIKLRDRAPSKTPRRMPTKKITKSEAKDDSEPGRHGDGVKHEQQQRKVTDHQMILVEIMNSYDLPEDLEDALMRVVRAIKGPNV